MPLRTRTRRTSRSHRPPGGKDRGRGQGRHARPRAGREDRGCGRGRHAGTRRPPAHLSGRLAGLPSGSPRLPLARERGRRAVGLRLACTDVPGRANATEQRAAAAAMTWIPAGTFLMGSEDFYPEERPLREVSVAGFWMDEHPVTAAQYRRFVRETGYVTVAERPLRADDYPDADPESPRSRLARVRRRHGSRAAR